MNSSRITPILFRSILASFISLVCLQLTSGTQISQETNQSDVKTLVRRFKDPDPEVRSFSALKLGEMGQGAKEALPELIEILKDQSLDVRTRTLAAYVIGQIGREARVAVGALVDALKNQDPDPNLRIASARALGQIGPEAKDAVPALVDALNDSDANVRTESVIAFKQIGPEAKIAVQLLVKMLKDPDSAVRIQAIAALEGIGPEARDAISSLRGTVEDEKQDEYVRQRAASALGRIGPEAKDAVPALVEMLRDEGLTLSTRITVARALGQIGPGAKDAVPALVEMLKYPGDGEVRKSAATALGDIGIGAKPAIPALVEALDDREEEVRIVSSTALGELSTALANSKDATAVIQLKVARDALLNSPYPEVRKHAERVQLAIENLEMSWLEQLRQWVVTHPFISLAIAAYPLLLLAWLAFLWLRPLWLLYMNETLAKISDLRLPEMLGGITVTPRYLILVGFFQYRTRVLDAWVTKYISSARTTFSSFQTVKDRQIFVPLPVMIDDEAEADLSPARLRPIFSRNLIWLQVRGEGGAGKTSLACRIAQWGMSPQKEARPRVEHYMLPVLLEPDMVIRDKEQADSLLKAIQQQVKVMINEDDPPPSSLLRQLLKKRRLLLILDGFSEMNETSRAATLAGITDLPANAGIITTRAEEQLFGIPTTVIEPLRVKGNRLSTFMEAYLTARKKRDLFDDEEFFEACRRLSLIVGDRDITALLAKLYAEQMIAVKEKATDSDTPANIPELMLSYLNDLCRDSRTDDPDIRIVHRAAKSIAWECLKKKLRPIPAQREEVLSVLGVEEQGKSLLTYLEERLKVIQTVGAGRDRIRFALDPLAEYLAGMHLVEKYGEDKQAWGSFLDRVDKQGGAPEEIKGFLLAIRDCCLAKGEDLQALRTVADDLAQRAGISPEESNRYRIERRVKQLIPRLKYSEAKDRMNAVEELGVIGSQAKIAVIDLCVLLRDQDKEVRRRAADALGLIGEGAKAAAPHLCEALKDPDGGLRSSAATALMKLQAGAMPNLIEALKDHDEKVRRRAVDILGGIRACAASSAPHLIEALRSPEAGVRKSVTRALGRLGEGVVPQLIEALKDKDEVIRLNAASALGRIGKGAQEAVPYLSETLKDSNAIVRMNAASALGHIGEGAREAIPHLTAALKDPNEAVRRSAAFALEKIRQD